MFAIKLAAPSSRSLASSRPSPSGVDYYGPDPSSGPVRFPDDEPNATDGLSVTSRYVPNGTERNPVPVWVRPRTPGRVGSGYRVLPVPPSGSGS
uniref:Putative secreted protein n=1 Tax=Ixodes ricinus TaxID=34613 RepID=A0A0K8R5D8_IXORI